MERIDEPMAPATITWLTVGRDRFDHTPILQGPVLWIKIVNVHPYPIGFGITLRDQSQEAWTVPPETTLVVYPNAKDRADIVGGGG